jgi:sugar phosphate isomerase/epimerase
MANLEPLQVGVMFWTGGVLGFDASPDEIVASVASLGVKCGQLGVHGTADVGPEAQQAWKAALDNYGVSVVTVFPGFAGESYESIPICAATVGFVPAETRAAREERAYRVSDFAKALGVPGMASHIGCLPHDRSHPDYVGVRDLMQRVCDYCAKNGQTFALETGQEPAANLLQFLRDVDRDNLGINFDPANLILYGFGGPLEALELVKDHLITVHCKDGSFPAEKGQWGKETPLGKGDVGMDKFVAKLKEVGYKGPLTIEREIVGEAQRADIQEAIALLERLRAA